MREEFYCQHQKLIERYIELELRRRHALVRFLCRVKTIDDVKQDIRMFLLRNASKATLRHTHLHPATIVARQIVYSLRSQAQREWRRWRLRIAMPTDRSESYDEQFELREECRRLRQLVRGLPDVYAETLNALYGLTESPETGIAIARRMGVSSSMVYKRHNRALTLLRERFMISESN